VGRSSARQMDTGVSCPRRINHWHRRSSVAWLSKDKKEKLE
jgi:hypothetical protein